jgi:hypothetical protein
MARHTCPAPGIDRLHLLGHRKLNPDFLASNVLFYRGDDAVLLPYFEAVRRIVEHRLAARELPMGAVSWHQGRYPNRLWPLRLRSARINQFC